MHGGTDIDCMCFKDSTEVTYKLGNKYPPYDSANHINTYYTDSCTRLKTLNGFDSSRVEVITL